jgi:hypothetical protein
MRALSNIVALCGALFLIAAAVAWWKVVTEPEHEPTAGRVGVDSRRVKAAARITAAAFLFSGLAAIIAVLDWIIRD